MIYRYTVTIKAEPDGLIALLKRKAKDYNVHHRDFRSQIYISGDNDEATIGTGGGGKIATRFSMIPFALVRRKSAEKDEYLICIRPPILGMFGFLIIVAACVGIIAQSLLKHNYTGAIGPFLLLMSVTISLLYYSIKFAQTYRAFLSTF